MVDEDAEVEGAHVRPAADHGQPARRRGVECQVGAGGHRVDHDDGAAVGVVLDAHQAAGGRRHARQVGAHHGLDGGVGAVVVLVLRDAHGLELAVQRRLRADGRRLAHGRVAHPRRQRLQLLARIALDRLVVHLAGINRVLVALLVYEALDVVFIERIEGVRRGVDVTAVASVDGTGVASATHRRRGRGQAHRRRGGGHQ